MVLEPTLMPLLSVADRLIVPVYVPPGRPALLALTVNELPLPVSEAGVESDSHVVVVPAVQLTGREQVPVSLSETLCGAGDASPCEAANARFGPAIATQGGNTVRVATTCCGLPVARVPALSVAEIVKLALTGGPPGKPFVLTLTTKASD